MRLVGNDHYVPAVGKQRMPGTFAFREKLLNGRKNHATRGHGKELLQIVTVLSLDRLLPQEFVTPRKRPEQLVVQVVAVSEHNECRILHLWFKDQPACVERHRERFP